MIDEFRKPLSAAIANISDLAIYSEGALTFSEAKRMTPLEFRTFQHRLNRYFEEKAKAMKEARAK